MSTFNPNIRLHEIFNKFSGCALTPDVMQKMADTAHKNNYSLRIVREGSLMTKDYCISRVNATYVENENGVKVISRFYIG
jgi:hypothetical protein